MSHHSRLSKIVIDVPPADHDREVALIRAPLREAVQPHRLELIRAEIRDEQ